jgi:hypothetical protein
MHLLLIGNNLPLHIDNLEAHIENDSGPNFKTECLLTGTGDIKAVVSAIRSTIDSDRSIKRANPYAPLVPPNKILPSGCIRRQTK